MESLDLITPVKKLCDVLPSASEVKKLRVLLSKESWSESDRQNVLQQLCNLLLRPAYIEKVAAQCSGLLLELLVFHIQTARMETAEVHEQVATVLGHLVGNHSQVARFCLQYFKDKPSITSRLQCTIEEPLKKKIRKTKGKSPGRTAKNAPVIQKTLLHLLCQDRDYFSTHWNWNSLVPICSDPVVEARWLACHCLALVTEMPESKLNILLRHDLTDDQVFEMICRNRYFLETQHPMMPDVCRETQESNVGLQIRPTPTTNQLAIVSGVPLLKASQTTGNWFQAKDPCDSLVIVPSVFVCLRQLALAVSSGHPCLIRGPVGCGKTLLIEYLAAITGRKLVKVQMGDQVDGKLLVGLYCCTNVPGEFVWRPGPLTSAMEEGHWLLLEDIDYAPKDVVSLLVPVLKNGSLIVPGQTKVLRASPGFQLFASRRLVSSVGVWHSENRGSSDLLGKLWHTATLPLISEEELLQVILTKWPQLEPLQSRIISLYQILTSTQQFGTGLRQFTIRDLFKWCNRISQNFSLVSTDGGNQIFLSALDCFCLSVPNAESRMCLAAQIGELLNIPLEKSNYFCIHYIPDMKLSSVMVEVGRFSSKLKEKAFTGERPSSWFPVFARTRQALSVLESVAMATAYREPVLLVGETGTGKTSIVQYLAHITGQKIMVVNMNQQSDSMDLLGGYKPVDLKIILAPLRMEFESLFLDTFSATQNEKFLCNLMLCYAHSRWEDLLHLMMYVTKNAVEVFQCKDSPSPKERSKLLQWQELGQKIMQQRRQVTQAKQSLIFTFVKGVLVKAVETGYWILLDEINLAENETLECLAELLDSSSISLLENGEVEHIRAHQDFRLFACMNPATDVGKKELPPGIRNRFTEIFMEELEDKQELFLMVSSYLHSLNLPTQLLDNIVLLYLTARKLSRTEFTDGTGHPPHFSLRTLCRALSYAASNPYGSVLRSLYEAFCLSFLTQLSCKSRQTMEQLISKHLLGKERISLLKAKIPEPPGGNYLFFEGFWICRGELEPHRPKHYILTPTVQQNLSCLARVVSARRHPVLLQGETSVGKTSLIDWLAQASGNVCIRVNNHEHTDLQEYVGSYIANHRGKLIFQEGVLVKAMRKGYWIILDELNLAPTEVLEALNRVLDDNRELFISETQTVVKADPNFMLFATQNPPGLYGGRKVLSRAFRNRFIELHFEEIPKTELEEILQKRCALPPTYCKKMVDVMSDLQLRRRESTMYAGKQGYITLRDLFRWGERYRLSNIPPSTPHDWYQYLAEQGYMLLVGRVRRVQEAETISEVIEKHMKRKIEPKKIFSLEGTEKDEGPSLTTAHTLKSVLQRSPLPSGFEHIVWTENMRRLAVLVGQAVEFREPILLVGKAFLFLDK